MALELHKNVTLNTLVFFGLVAVVLVAVALGIWPLLVVFKPLLLVLLSVWFFFSSRRYGDRFTILVQAGLFFSLLGDIALLFSEKDQFNFLLGLGSFVIAGFAYSLAFVQNILDGRTKSGLALAIGLAVAVLAISGIYYNALYKHLHEMLIPVSGFGAVLVLMSCFSAFRFKRTYSRGFWMVFLGALFFLASYMLLGYDKYVADVPTAAISITALYALAQYLIVRGALTHVEKPSRQRA